MDRDERELLLKLIHNVKAWGDKSLPIEKRVELLGILNTYLGVLRENGKLSEGLMTQSLWRKASKCPKASA